MQNTRRQRTPWQIQKSVVFALFIRELRARAGHYNGGYIWLLVEPLVHIVALTMVRGLLRDRSMYGIDYPVFIAVAIVPFLLFRNTTLRVMEGVDANRGLFAFKQIKPFDTFVGRALLDSMVSIIVFVLILTILAWLGFDTPLRDPLPIMVIFALLVFMGMGLGMVYCVITHYMPELKIVLRMSMMVLYFTSGVIFPVSRMPQEWLPYLLWNPLLHAIEMIRNAFFAQYHMITGISPLYLLMSTLVLLAFGLTWYWSRRLEMLAR